MIYVRSCMTANWKWPRPRQSSVKTYSSSANVRYVKCCRERERERELIWGEVMLLSSLNFDGDLHQTIDRELYMLNTAAHS